ncbi:class II fumarate hydratase [Methanohalophilus portucalensis]|uniref:Aspartate ammonia-lyase n=2 Tax=Methanohalophilus portucalensis TaxID=39664 RepID=A0A1L9C7L3_9EURY|nr:aspartate ammonia-lyase [Methanohalophilus portucalensis]OJH50451.1 fumarase [Methanohalophilus portucalensis FDF-1]RNI11123.1 aspartate ammonia-lyase [Methanohalophilus portucalensis FDF-1]SMH29905.1 fumarase, class II [Methanohalophilus portucalensis FDF-1]
MPFTGDIMVRVEKDTLGEVEVPDNVYYGPQTARAVINFRVSGQRLPPAFIRAQAAIKMASAKANMKAAKLDRNLGEAIYKAAQEVRSGRFDGHFVLDAFQSGAGTSQNMNANEVIANRALEILGYHKGRYDVVHPNDHVNMSQSSNDATHTAIHIAATEKITNKLLPVLNTLQDEIDAKAKEYIGVVKPGRTHLQDAVPVTLGQEFSGYSRMLELDKQRLESTLEDLKELNMGGTATGTGLNTPEGFGDTAIQEMNHITGIDFRLVENPFEATQGAGAILGTSAALKGIAVSLIKVANDLRLLSSGPRTGFGEIVLPAVQPGSSIMPGKVNPVMAEMLNMVCFQVVGNDTAIMMAAQAGQCELNVFTPVLAHNILNSITILTGGIDSFNERCLRGLTVNADHCSRMAESSLALGTSLAPIIGYERAAEITYEAYRTNSTIREVVERKDLGLSKEEIDDLLDPLNMTGAGNDRT